MTIVYYKHFQNCSCFLTTNIHCFCSLVHRPTGWCPQIVSCIQGCVFVLEPRMKQQWPLSTPFSPQWTKAKKCWQISMKSCHVDPQSGTGTVTSTHTYRSMPGLVSKSVVWDVHPPGMGTLQCPVQRPWKILLVQEGVKSWETQQLCSPQDAAPQTFLHSQRIARFTRLLSLSFSLLKI